MLETEVVDKIKILCYITLFSENRVIYETTCKNVVEPEKLRKKIRRMRIAYWISNATECSIYCFSTAANVMRTRLNVRLNLCRPSFYFLFLPRDGNRYKIVI